MLSLMSLWQVPAALMQSCDHVAQALAARAENKWEDVRTHMLMSMVTAPPTPRAYLLLAESDFHLSKFFACQKHLAKHLTSDPVCQKGLERQEKLTPLLSQVPGMFEAEDGEDEEAPAPPAPMSPTAAEAAVKELRAQRSARSAAAERAEELAAHAGPSRGGSRMYHVKVSIPISLMLREVLSRHKEIAYDSDSVTFSLSNGNAKRTTMDALQRWQPADTFWACDPPRTVARQPLPDYLRRDLQFPKETFVRLIKDVLAGLKPTEDLKFSKDALKCLQEASETYLQHMFAKVQLLASHAKRKTIFLQDLVLVEQLEKQM